MRAAVRLQSMCGDVSEVIYMGNVEQERRKLRRHSLLRSCVAASLRVRRVFVWVSFSIHGGQCSSYPKPCRPARPTAGRSSRLGHQGVGPVLLGEEGEGGAGEREVADHVDQFPLARARIVAG